MRTIEYALLTILLFGVIVYGATKVGAAISGSFNNTAILIDGAR